ncbi:GIN domain-containing protein [Cystobacter ferrugineus]|uniref:Putative auto-transporter adhesin head GIN domain-containing protein n=1 Tax=Cystobacter ferrugineus TaxID=83449 RepID=A0A1L9B057_9BACT|nr:DUF2807 domain-containing protein [Cystobacter ferrugineus]OJH35634.1 hypothetical protein BON30_36820 [Cystobacter ferrugineus]
MWKSLCVGVAALTFMFACDRSGELGNGHKVTQPRELTGFTRVENRTPLDVEVREASAESVTLTLDENLLPFVITRVSGETLFIENTTNLLYSGEGRVVATLPRFLGAGNAGSGDFLVEGVTQSNALTFELSGSGGMAYCGPASRLTVNLPGSGNMTLCTPREQVLEEVRLGLSGSGSLTYDGSTASMVALLEGSGGMSLTGSAPRLVARVTSSGGLEARGLISSEAELDLTGSGNMSATVDTTATVHIDGSGSVDLWGNATLRDMRITGSGSLRRH